MKTFHKFSLFTSICGWILILAGALVTSTGSGLSVPDWPLSYGTLFPKMQGGVLFEHGHRLVAGFVATLTIIMAVWAYLKIENSIIRKLSYAALGAVILQAVLGGMTVLYQLPTWISVSHACLGQTYFCILCLITLMSSDFWLNAEKDSETKTLLPILAGFFSGIVFIQLFLGAWMRHIGAGLAIPDFPKSFGHWVPPFFSYWTKVHFAHRIGALCISLYTIFFLTFGFIIHRKSILIRTLLVLLLMLVATQITLGSFVIWTGKNALITSLHVLCGASILATLVLLTAISFRKYDSHKSYLLLSDYVSLGKPRITTMVCMTTFVGFYLASKDHMDVPKLLATLLSVFLVSFGSCSLNQVIEVNEDRAMDRTKNRPLPSGRLTMSSGISISIATVMIGIIVMALEVNSLATVFLIFSFLGYAIFYTPLKKVTNLNTLIGAIPGALPPMIGWMAATGQFAYQGLLLFMIMFFWQLPHFLAIAWMFGDDYKKAKMRMLPLTDPKGDITARQALLYTFALMPIGLIPSLVGLTGIVYFIGSLIVSIWFLRRVYSFFLIREKAQARRMMFGSLIYLTCVFVLMVADRV